MLKRYADRKRLKKSKGKKTKRGKKRRMLGRGEGRITGRGEKKGGEERC